jgi:hypothetical protein
MNHSVKAPRHIFLKQLSAVCLQSPDDRTKGGHAPPQLRWHAAVIERKVSAASSSCHSILLRRDLPRVYQGDEPGRLGRKGF